MSERIIQICDWCGCEKEKDSDYWACCHAEVEWKVPPDGINGGRFKGTLCATCRAKFDGAIAKLRRECEARPDAASGQAGMSGGREGC